MRRDACGNPGVASCEFASKRVKCVRVNHHNNEQGTAERGAAVTSWQRSTIIVVVVVVAAIVWRTHGDGARPTSRHKCLAMPWKPTTSFTAGLGQIRHVE
jgi:hypothetical protein